MKITEPKTPYAPTYDPAEDEDEIEAIDPKQLVVDELDKSKGKKAPRESDIPDLDIGEPEADLAQEGTPDSEKRVLMDEHMADGDEGTHGEDYANMTHEEREKHRKFEEMRRKHYEMRNVKNLLG